MSWHLDLIAVSKDRATAAVQEELARRQGAGHDHEPATAEALGQAIAGVLDLLPELGPQMGLDLKSEGCIEPDHGRILIEISTIRMAK